MLGFGPVASYPVAGPDALAVSGTTDAAITAAAGVSTTGTLTGSAIAESTITAAVGVSTTGTLVGSGGGSTITAAAGVSTTGTLAGSSVAESTITAAAGVSTTGTLYSFSEAYSTSAVVYYAVRVVSGLWSETGVNPASVSLNLRSWLPPPRHPWGYVVGDKVMVDPIWYRFFQYVAEVRLGGIGGANVGDVVATVEAVQAESVAQAATVASVSTQTQANAEALEATVQVSVNNGLAGALQIPPVRLNSDEAIR